MARILKKYGRLGKEAAADVARWGPADLRDFLACIATGHDRTSMMDDASEALAYLNWRHNRRLHESRSHEAQGGDRCKAERFEGRA